MRIEKVFVAATCSPLLQDGNTPLHLASRNGKTELCKWLVGAKANVEARNKVLKPRADKMVTLVRNMTKLLKYDIMFDIAEILTLLVLAVV